MNSKMQFPPGAWSGPTSTHGGAKYGELIEALRQFLNAFAGSKPDLSLMEEIKLGLQRWTERLKSEAVNEAEQVYARRADLIGRGQATWPAADFFHFDGESLTGKVRFGRYFLGRNGAVHGGAILFLFDEMSGRITHLLNEPMVRTAYVNTNFRAITPIDVELKIKVTRTEVSGRKRFMKIELWNGDVLCAEAEALMVELRPGQP